MSNFMRLIVFFDLPVKTKEERHMATSFRNALVNDGYYMVQYSVYARLCNGPDGAEKHYERLKKIAPSTGSIRVLSVTEKQYASIKIIAGEKKPPEKESKYIQLTFI